eukprot:scaffold70749_cov62-Phaeocystis_antarctica.AAC.3
MITPSELDDHTKLIDVVLRRGTHASRRSCVMIATSTCTCPRWKRSIGEYMHSRLQWAWSTRLADH